MSVVERLNSALSGRYRTERELGEGGIAVVLGISILRRSWWRCALSMFLYMYMLSFTKSVKS